MLSSLFGLVVYLLLLVLVWVVVLCSEFRLVGSPKTDLAPRQSAALVDCGGIERQGSAAGLAPRKQLIRPLAR